MKGRWPAYEACMDRIRDNPVLYWLSIPVYLLAYLVFEKREPTMVLKHGWYGHPDVYYQEWD